MLEGSSGKGYQGQAKVPGHGICQLLAVRLTCGRYFPQQIVPVLQVQQFHKTSLGPRLCQARAIPADALEEVAWRRFSEAIRHPAVLVGDLRSYFETGGGDIGHAMLKLQKDVQDLREQQRRLIELRQKDVVDQEILEGQLAPLKVLFEEKQQALRVLEMQLQQRGDVVEMERRIVEMCSSVSEKLDELDFDGKRATLGAFGVKLVVSREELSITMVVSPEFAAITESSM